MANKITNTDNYTAIANAIRAKNGSSDTYTPSQMATAISNIPSGTSIPINTKFSHTQPTIIKEIFYDNEFDTSNYTDMSYMFANCCDRTRGSDAEEYLLYLGKLKTQSIINMEGMFQNNTYIRDWSSIHFENFNTSNVTNMSYMFNKISHYPSSTGNTYTSDLDLKTFDTSNVTDMSYMFNNSVITFLDLSNWDTTKVTNMSYMFANSTIYTDLSPLNLSHFNTRNTTINHMFEKLSIGNLIANNWTLDTNDLRAMFKGCSGSFTLQNWTVPSGAQFGDGGTSNGTFQESTGLTYLDLSGWTAPNIASTKYMFYKCTSLQTLDISGFDLTTITTSAEYNSMFGGSIASTRVPASCLIYVKDQANKDWINGKFSWLTNVQIKQ